MRLLLLFFLLTASASAQVYVVNQGNFSAGDGSLTQIPFSGDAVQLFDGQLGSILQSASQYGDELYLVSNSANRIEVVSAATNARVGQITGGLSSPRYVAFVEIDYVEDRATKAYVSNQVYGGVSYVLPLDPVARTTGTPIPVDGLPEMIAYDLSGSRKAYVALGTFGPGGGGRDSLAVLDASTDTLLGYIDIGCYARSVVASQDGEHVLAFCEDTDEVVVVTIETDAVVQRLAFQDEFGDEVGYGQSVGPGEVVFPVRRPSPPAMSFFAVTTTGVVEVSQAAEGYQLGPTIPIPEVGTRLISAVALSPAGVLVLGRPDPDNPFSADGTVTVHDVETGALLATYPAGVYPVHVVVDDRVPIAAESAPEAAGLGLTLAGANPVRHHTALDLTLDRSASVRVDLLDGLGRYVATVTDDERLPGVHRLRLDVGTFAPGTYVARAVAEGRAVSLPITVIR